MKITRSNVIMENGVYTNPITIHEVTRCPFCEKIYNRVIIISAAVLESDTPCPECGRSVSDYSDGLGKQGYSYDL